MSPQRKIGPRVDAATWDDFKSYCEAKNGKQGTVGEELEAAMRSHMGTTEREDIRRELRSVQAKLDYLLSETRDGQA